MKVRVTVSFNHDMNNADEATRLIDYLKEDGRITSAIHMYGGDAINFDWERRRDRKAKPEAPVDNIVPVRQAT